MINKNCLTFVLVLYSFQTFAGGGGGNSREIPGCAGRHANRTSLENALQGKSRVGSQPIDSECAKYAHEAAEKCEAEPENRGLDDAESAGASGSAGQMAAAYGKAKDVYLNKASECAEAREKLAGLCEEAIQSIETERESLRQAEADEIEAYKSKGGYYESEMQRAVTSIQYKYDEMDRKLSKKRDAHVDARDAVDRFLGEEGLCKMNHAKIYELAANQADSIKQSAGAAGALPEMAKDAAKAVGGGGLAEATHAAEAKGISELGEKGAHGLQHASGSTTAQRALGAAGKLAAPGACVLTGGGVCAVTSVAESATTSLLSKETLNKAVPVVGGTVGRALGVGFLAAEVIFSPSPLASEVCDNPHSNPIDQYQQCGFYTFSTMSANESAIRTLSGK